MAKVLKNLRVHYKNLQRIIDGFLSKFCISRRLIRPSTVMIIYILWQVIEKLISYSGPRVSVERLPELEPLVTVIVTVYNIQPFIQTAIRAVLTQTYRNLEVIVVDDASSDKSMRYAKQVTSHDKRVKYLSLQENSLGGVGIPTNIALEQAKGKYIALVDGDDLPKVNFISKMVNLSSKLDLDICICKFRSFENITISKEEYDLSYWPKPELLAESQLRALDPLEIPNIFRLSPEPWRKLYKKEFLEKNNIKFPEGDFLFEDNAFHWFVLRQTRRVSLIDEELIWHRENRRGQTTEFRKTDKPIHHGMVKKSQSESRMMQKEYYVSARKYFLRASHFLNINTVGQDIRKCKERARYCKIVRTQFLTWIYRYKWLLALVESLENKKAWKKFASIYFRTLEYWSEQFKSSYLQIPRRKRRIAQEISKAGEVSILISIVVYCRNIERFIYSKPLKFEHMKEEIEFIFLEDDSEDSTLEELAKIEEQYHNVHVIHTGGRGTGKAFNFAMPLCEGNYIAFLNYDSFADLGILESILPAAKETYQDVIVFSQSKLPHDGSFLRQHHIRRNINNSINQDWLRGLHTLKIGNINSIRRGSLCKELNVITVVRREFILRNSIFFGGSGIEDTLQYNWHSLLSSKSITVLPIRRNSTPEYEHFISNSTRSKRYYPFKTLDVLLKANRILIRNGITEDTGFHEDWKKFCAKRIAEGRQHFRGLEINRYNRDASLVLKVIESHRDTIQVKSVR